MTTTTRRARIGVVIEGASSCGDPLDVPEGHGASQVATSLQSGVTVGRLTALQSGVPMVTVCGELGPVVPARTTVELAEGLVGSSVVVMFEGGARERPIIVGVIREPATGPRSGGVELQADGERVVVSAKEQVVLQCGAASITLTRAGKVIIHGSYLVSRSSGLNRIVGGSVQIN
jgi:hypothetical protein